MSGPRIIHAFIASPGDLAIERRAFKQVIDELNGGFGDGAGVKFVGLGWEDTLASTGRQSQKSITTNRTNPTNENQCLGIATKSAKRHKRDGRDLFLCGSSCFLWQLESSQHEWLLSIRRDYLLPPA